MGPSLACCAELTLRAPDAARSSVDAARSLLLRSRLGIAQMIGRQAGMWASVAGRPWVEIGGRAQRSGGGRGVVEPETAAARMMYVIRPRVSARCAPGGARAVASVAKPIEDRIAWIGTGSRMVGVARARGARRPGNPRTA